MAKPKRNYNMTPAAKEQRLMAANQSAMARRTDIQNKMASKLDMIMDAVSPEEIADASFKDKGTVAGIFYDKLYRDNHSTPHTAIQVNIQTIGQDQGQVEPLMVDINPKPIDTNVSKENSNAS
jgi:hypothetical protein